MTFNLTIIKCDFRKEGTFTHASTAYFGMQTLSEPLLDIGLLI